MLTCTLTTGNFIPEYVVILGVFQDIRGPWTGRMGIKASDIKQDNGYGAIDTVQKTARKSCKYIVHNLLSIQYLQVGTRLKIRIETDISEEMIGESITLTNAGLPFCMSYHLKGVCKSNCGGRNAHRRLLTSEHVLLAEFKTQLCGAAPPPVLKIDAGFLGVTTISPRIRTMRGGSQGSGATTYPTPWTTMDTGRTKSNTSTPPKDDMLPEN